MQDYGAQNNYLNRFKGIFQADKIFTISQTTFDDLVVYLNLDPNTIVNIDGAPIPRSSKESKSPNLEGVEKDRFILYPSGDDLRKNNDRTIAAFESFNNSTKDKYKLVVTSRFSPRSRQELLKLSKNVVFSGNVSESELAWLYHNSAMVLFPPEYEGLGLPVLEAVSEEKKIVCSDIKVFNEISETAFYMCDPYSETSIKDALNKAHEDSGFDKKLHYSVINKKYTWQRSANIFIRNLDIKKKPNSEQLQKIAIIGPDPSGHSSIGKFIQETHPAFSKKAEVTYFLERSPSSKNDKPSYLKNVADCKDIAYFNTDNYRTFDQVIYHIGSSDYHIQSIKKALCLPGKLVLHDTDMKGIMDYFLTNGHFSERRFKLEQRLTELLAKQTGTKPYINYASCIVNSHPVVVAHSNYASNAVKSGAIFNQKVVSLQHPIGTPNLRNRNRSKLINIGLAGILHDSKGMQILEGLLASGQLDNSRVFIFGYDFATSKNRLQSVTEYANVELTVNLSDLAFQEKLSKLDILLNYRPYYHGEASRATLEAMRYGVVPVVRNIGWFSELPDETAYKVDNIEDIPKALGLLMSDEAFRKKLSEKSVLFTRKDCSSEEYATKLLAAKGAGDLMNVKDILQSDNKINTSILSKTFKDILG